jgi:hypothetical protein
LPLVICPVAEDISIPVGKYIISPTHPGISGSRLCAGSPAVVKSIIECRSASIRSAVASSLYHPSGAIETATIAEWQPVVVGKDAGPAAIDIRSIITGEDILVAVKIVTVIAIVTIAVPDIRGTINMGSPPASPSAAIAPAEADAKTVAVIEPARSITKTHAPSGPGIIAHRKTPGPGTGIIKPVIPWIIIKPGAVDDRGTIDISIEIAWRVSFIHIIRGDIIYVYIFDII